MLVLFVLSILYFVRGEWVEILQTVSPNQGLTPRPSYKIVMKSVITDDFTTLPPTTIATPIEKRSGLLNLTTDSSTTPKKKVSHEEENNDEGFVGLINTIQNKLINHKNKGLKNKISTLNNLRNNLLHEIGDRINKLFGGSMVERQARGLEDDHEMHFPSNEGALMTIGFLTFAVFLIKLVLKLIYALKSKANTQTISIPTAGGASTTATTFIGRKKRDTDHLEAIKILQLIEDYNFH